MAECFYRGVSQAVEDRIEELTEFPTKCPHGHLIPTRDGVMPSR